LPTCLRGGAVKPLPDKKGYFGPYGGRFVPETLMAPLEQLTESWQDARRDSCHASVSSSRGAISVSGTKRPPYGPKYPRLSGSGFTAPPGMT
ncbi:MAG TPA: hypothetical protein VMT19_06925, partial [Thermoanaerobaculaceae bacterium]|nr:hypothetical protein [Thermoanaerobaculaceae bacterium]